MHFSLYYRIIILLFICQLPSYLVGQTQEVEIDQFSNLPQQVAPPEIKVSSVIDQTLNFGPDTNLIRVLKEIRELAQSGKVEDAQKMAGAVLEKIAESEENSFYLNQIRKEETKLYYKLAQEAMANKKYSLASQFLSRYRANIDIELQGRKRQREIALKNEGSTDAT